MGDDRDQGLMSSREAAWPVVKRLDLAQSGCLRQLKVCHSKARLTHQTSVASVTPCCILAPWLALTVTVGSSHCLRDQNSVSHNEEFSLNVGKTSLR